MSSNLKYRQERIQEKRKQTPWREFVMEICSWYSLGLYKRGREICMFPDTARRKNIVSNKKYELPELLDEDNYKDDDFFESLEKLFFTVNQPDRLYFSSWNENAEYASSCFWVKNAYLSFEAGMWSKNVLYSNIVYDNCIDVMASQSITDNCSDIFNSFHVTSSSNVFSSKYIHNSNEIYWCTNMIWCNECIECHNLTNASYCYKGALYLKEEYMKIKYDYLSQIDLIKKYEILSEKWVNTWCDDCDWSALLNAERIQNSHCIVNVKNGRNIIFFQWWWSSSNIYDMFHGWIECNHIYASVSTWENIDHVYCSIQIAKCSFLYYCSNLENCSYCLGCIGLKNKSYCILNKQYTKEVWYKKVDEIFSQMEQDWTLWEFFPWNMNPFYFNDTAAYFLDDSFTKEEVEARGYLWRDDPITVDIPEWVQTVRVDELGEYEGWRSRDWGSVVRSSQDPSIPQDDDGHSEWLERWIDPEIMKKVILDEEGNAYRVIPMEYEFLMKHGLPLPRKHWLERIKQHFVFDSLVE